MGVLGRRPEWGPQLASFEAEAAWIMGDWSTVRRLDKRGPAVGQVLLALQEQRDLGPVLAEARRIIGNEITSKQYSRSYQPILQLHLLREIEMIDETNRAISSKADSMNRQVLNQRAAEQLFRTLRYGLLTTAPSFRVSEAILSIRRTAFGSIASSLLKPEVGLAWLQTSKIARKAGYEQTAYSAILQAKEADAPFAFIQQAKLLKLHGGAFKALTDLQNSVTLAKKGSVIDMTESTFARDRNMAKVRRQNDAANNRPYYWKPDGPTRQTVSKRIPSSRCSPLRAT
jgi:serine/threonine-protein kinase ATR